MRPMPRQARLDAPGTLPHGMLRGIEQRGIVSDAALREDFVARTGTARRATATAIEAWALLPNHAHLLLRSGPPGLPKCMARQFTGYALRYNRHHRQESPPQSRDTSIVRRGLIRAILLNTRRYPS